jgi:DNA-binding HxlR family transcriptional regulator/SAM-dependent methyltransferase
MTSDGYNQFCPVAKACEVLEPRWTLLLLCEMWSGSTRFNDIRRGVPGMSPTLMSKRLREMEARELIIRTENPATGEIRYTTTPKADELEPIVHALGAWAHRNVEADVTLEHLDARLLMWNMRRKIDARALPRARRSVIEFIYPELPRDERRYWLIAKPGMPVDLCSTEPGHDVGLLRVRRPEGDDVGLDGALQHEGGNRTGPDIADGRHRDRRVDRSLAGAQLLCDLRTCFRPGHRSINCTGNASFSTLAAAPHLASNPLDAATGQAAGCAETGTDPLSFGGKTMQNSSVQPRHAVPPQPASLQPAPDLAGLKMRQQAAWASGDYAVIGTSLQIVGETLCEALDIRSGDRVLDVAAGNGNATLAAARRWCRVTSTDYVPALLEKAKLRATAEGLDVMFETADAEALPQADASFDVVLSTFGVMFAPNQERAASEMLRVCKPGGKIGLANWTPEGFIGHLFKAIGKHLPPPAGVRPPALWGTMERLNELFGTGGSVSATPRVFVFRYRSPQHWVDVFRTWYGPVHKAFAALPADQQEVLEADLLALIGRFNRAGDGTMVVPSDYLEVVVTRAKT